MSPHPLIAQSTEAADSVGAKAATLARLASLGFPVPDFFAVRSSALSEHLSANGIDWSADPAAVRELIVAAQVPDSVSGPVLQAYDRLSSRSGQTMVSVRSSGAEEDSERDSFAGQFDSFLGVEGAGDLLRAIKACWSSALSDRSIAYRASREIAAGSVPDFSVVVQVQVFAEKAGVLLTVHPLDPDGETAYLEANFGTGESVVGSLATPDGITFSRSSGKVVQKTIGSKRRMTLVSPGTRGSTLVEVEPSISASEVLTEAQAEEIFALGMRIEQLLGRPQDIEWAFDSRGPWILQARPVTVPAGRGQQ